MGSCYCCVSHSCRPSVQPSHQQSTHTACHTVTSQSRPIAQRNIEESHFQAFRKTSNRHKNYIWDRISFQELRVVRCGGICLWSQQRQGDLCKFQTILVYTVSSRLARKMVRLCLRKNKPGNICHVSMEPEFELPAPT